MKAIIAQERLRLGLRKNFLGRTERSDFWVRPFLVQAFGLVFGLVVREPEEVNSKESQVVDAMPGWTQMFYPPWQNGLYDTYYTTPRRYKLKPSKHGFTAEFGSLNL